jgi:uncharacterized protein YegJ (DUF2314 family)
LLPWRSAQAGAFQPGSRREIRGKRERSDAQNQAPSQTAEATRKRKKTAKDEKGKENENEKQKVKQQRKEINQNEHFWIARRDGNLFPKHTLGIIQTACQCRAFLRAAPGQGSRAM